MPKIRGTMVPTLLPAVNSSESVRWPIDYRDALERVPAQDVRVRVLTIQTVTMGVSAEQEANWPELAAAAVLALEEGPRTRARGVVQDRSGCEWVDSGFRTHSRDLH